jgi:poly-gamma-glutamate synthase PgsB/CapB
VTILILALSVFLLYLVYERLALDRLRRQVPLVISVTGTRGKSSVVRLLASVLRESGRRVLAKTTGSQAQYVLPDGTMSDVSRRGTVSILEQKKTLRKAASLGVDCLVVEVMSVHPQNHVVESQKILKPDTVLLTNVRRDHTDAMGETEEEIARVLGLDLVLGTNVILPEKYLEMMQSTTDKASQVHFHPALPDVSGSFSGNRGRIGREVLSDNYDLVITAARGMGVADEAIARGVDRAVQDIGEFKIWKYRVDGKELFVVNAFAANDPESTMKLLDSVRTALSGAAASFAGLMHLRSDRADRTLQWMRVLSGSIGDAFASLYVVGGHAHALARKVKGARVLASDDPEKIMRSIGSQVPDRAVLFGFGNIGGIGAQLVEHWNQNGDLYGT